MKRKKVINRLLNVLLALTLVISGLGANIPQTTVMAASVKTSNMLTECVPYYLERSTIEDSVVMAGVTYNDTIKVHLDSDSHQRRIGFNLAELYTAVSFEVGHIDGTGTANGNIVLSTYKDGELCDSYDLDVNDIAKKISCDTVGVSQLEIVITYDYYTGIKGYFGIGALNFVGNSENSAINLYKTSNMSEECTPYYLERTTVEDSIVMGGVMYSDALKVSLDSDSTSRRIGFNLQSDYTNLSFEIGHIDKTGLANGDVVVSIYKDSVLDSSYDLNINDIAKKIKCDVTGVSQFELVITYDYYTGVKGYFGIGALNLQRNDVPISRVDLDRSSVLMKVGEEKLLNASIFPENATDKTLVWKSADTEVATVSQNGLVKAVSEGTTTITVAGGNSVTASCAVTVSSKDQEFPANPVHHCTKHDDGTDTTDWSYVYFGSYPQTEVTGAALTSAITGADYDANGDAWVNGTQYRRISKSDTTNDENFGDSAYRYFKWERMKWRVLENDGNTLFVMADKGLDCKIYYYEEGIPITWKNCTLRSWLNGSFYNTAFSSGEQGAIVEQTVVNEDTPEYGIEGGNDTNDKVHLLSFGEITNPTYGFCESDDTYSVSRYIKASDYAHTMGININGEGRYEGNCRWWLCSDTYRNYVDVVSINGCAIRKGSKVVSSDHAVVPTLHIDLSSDLWSMEDENEHTHSFSGTWKADSDNHWKECECGEKTEISCHIFNWVIDEPATETSTGLKHEECEVCSYKRNEGTVIDKISGEHTHSYRAWGRNEEAHWKECECGTSIEVGPHSFTWVIDEPATETAAGLKHEECEICSFKRNVGTVIDKISGEHTHSFSAAWKSDAQSHWIECGCGEKFAVASHAFSWITDKPATASTTGLKHEECAVCGYKRNQNTVIGKQGNIPAKGQELTDRKSGAVYRVISVETKGGTVEYTKSLNNKTANISIPSTVEIDGISYKVISIAANAFKNNKKITKVIIGNNVTSIGKNSFSGCSKLKTLTIGNNVALIGDNAFSNCTSLKKVTIPVKVKKIGKQAFYGCKKLKTIKINTKKLSGKFVGSKAFAKIDPKATVKVPSSCLKSYKKLFQKKGFNGKKQKIKK